MANKRTIEIDEQDAKIVHEFLSALVNAQRFGGQVDEPEGVRYVQISDTLANLYAARVMKIFGWCVKDCRIVKKVKDE